MSSNAITIMGRGELTPMEQHAAYLEARRDVIVKTFIPERFQSNAPLIDMYMDLCKARGLNPFAKQINCIPRGNKPSIEIAIDGYRLIASRASGYAGIDEYEYDAWDVPLPMWARCTVYKFVGGMRCAFTARVLWKEFGAPNLAASYDNQWKQRPFHMLGITAERHALRMAFPEEMGAVEAVNGELGNLEDTGLPEREVRPASRPIEQPIRATTLNSPRTTAGKASATQIKRLMAARAAAGWTEEEMYRVIALNWPDAQRDGKPSVRELTAEQIGELILTVETPIEDEDEPLTHEGHIRAIAHEQPYDGPIRDDEIVIEQQPSLTTV